MYIVKIVVSGDNTYTLTECTNGLDLVNITALYALNNSLLWAASNDGRIFKTVNGGTLWTRQYIHPNNPFIDGIYFWNENEGIAFGDPVAYPGIGPFTLLRTSDGGSTWKDISSTLLNVIGQYGITQRYDAVGSHFWFPTASSADSTDARFLFHSRDRGLTWEQIKVPPYFGDFEAAFSDSLNGIITNWNNKIARTTDGGKTWTVKNNGVGGGPLKGVKGTGSFWVEGYYDDASRTFPIFYSSDYGSTWVKQVRNSQVAITAFSIPSNTVAWACGYNYLIIRNSTANIATSVSPQQQTPSLPAHFELTQNYPNPFNPTTSIKYHVDHQGQVKLQVYDMAGKEIRTLVNEFQTTGWHVVRWDGRSNTNQGVSTGTYFYRIENNGQAEARKMLLLR
jgi:photosystem II stability/assembly factor-like uncharacterized protein